MWRRERLVARPDERVANKPFRIKGGKPDSGCLFCLEPSGEMHEYHMHMSDYSYFTCSKEECKSKGYNIAREVNKKIISFASDYLLKNIWKKEEKIRDRDEDELWITLEGREYLLSTCRASKGLTDTMREYDILFPSEENKRTIQTSMISILGDVQTRSQLVDDMWKQIFVTANEMIDDDDIRKRMEPLEHIWIEVEPYNHYLATEVTVDDFKIKIGVLEDPDTYGTPYDVTFLDNGELDFYEYGRHR